jgi:hypothetical protein
MWLLSFIKTYKLQVTNISNTYGAYLYSRIKKLALSTLNSSISTLTLMEKIKIAGRKDKRLESCNVIYGTDNYYKTFHYTDNFQDKRLEGQAKDRYIVHLTVTTGTPITLNYITYNLIFFIIYGGCIQHFPIMYCLLHDARVQEKNKIVLH